MTKFPIVNRVIDQVAAELERAYAKFPVPLKSNHEGYAVVLEELDEAWDEIKCNCDKDARKEMIQVAAMAIRFIADMDRREVEAIEVVTDRQVERRPTI
jgi:hypothetical protein